MPDIQAIKYSGQNYGANYELKKAVFSIKTAKTWTELEQALCINYFSKLDIYDKSFAEQFAPFKRGYLQKALGNGIRYIETYGAQQVRRFKPAKPGDKLCLEVPNNKNERSETIGAITRVYSSSAEADRLAGYNLFVDVKDMNDFIAAKMGEVKDSISLFLDLAFTYVLSIDPWGDEHADHFNAFTIGAMLGAKWDDTAIANFGDEHNGVGKLLSEIHEDLKKEVEKEKKLKNVNAYNVWDWCPKYLDGRVIEKTAKDNKKPKKPTAAFDSAKLQKMYFDNKKVDPNLAAASICNCLNYHIEMMINERTAQNDSQFPGNLENNARNYGKEEGKDKALFLPIKIPEDELVIIMNSDLYKQIKSAALVGNGIDSGAYNQYIQNFLRYDSKIIKLDTMPYGAFKLGSKFRYNQWDLYDVFEIDKLGQMDYVGYTAHRGVAFGIRELRPFKYIRLIGAYVNPDTFDQNIQFQEATEIK